MTKRILVTGAAGFFGHHLINHLLVNTDWEIIGLVRLGRIGNLRRLTDVDIWEQEFKKDRIQIVWHDLRSPITRFVEEQIGAVNYIVHAAASTHVDRSITHPVDFVMDNVLATAHMLQYARQLDGLQWFHYFSTDEVAGPTPEGIDFDEEALMNPTNPYSATKVGAEALVLAYANTYQLSAFITRTQNLIGERISHEKFQSIIMRKVLAGKEVTIHADSTATKPGSRRYLHCRNAAAAVLFLLEHAQQRNIYNVVGDIEVDNRQFARKIADVIGKPLLYELVDFHSSRPGHDTRYSLSGQKLKNMGFEFPLDFETTLEKTIRWTLENLEWLNV